MSNERNKMNECYSCEWKRNVPGDAHIRCANPDKNMTGNPHGVRNGWFYYPSLFDPRWKAVDCANYSGIADLSER